MPVDPRPVVTRFVPSPSGELHLGNARTALFNFLLARRDGGRFILRVEDTDAARAHPRLIEALLADLAWLGLEWDEGPDRGGPHGPYLQSQRAAIYQPLFARLQSAGRAYPCYCSAEELARSRSAQQAAGRPPRYAGTCRDLSDAERSARAALGRQPSLRFRVERGRRIELEDLVHGPQSWRAEDIGDFVIRRADGSATFFFVNAVDDALMQVSHVLRGEDHLPNTPRQLLLLEALELPAPRYGHVSLLLGPDGTPLSKRHGAVSVRALREAGYDASALLNHLFRLGHSGAPNALLTLAQMIGAFEVAHLQRSSAHADAAQLYHWQREWVRSLSSERARAWLEPLLPTDVARERAAAFIAAVLPNVVLPEDARTWWEVVFGARLEYEEAALKAAHEAGPEFFAAAAGAIGARAEGAVDLAALRAATGRGGAAFFTPLRAALTGRLHGPQLAPLLAAMPPERVRARLLRFAHEGARA